MTCFSRFSLFFVMAALVAAIHVLPMPERVARISIHRRTWMMHAG
jgi:hypothetical protein